jgi:hypothetical protein
LAIAIASISNRIRPEHLDRDDPAEPQPLGAIDHAHRALGHRFNDPVPAVEDGAGKIAVLHGRTIPQVICRRL